MQPKKDFFSNKLESCLGNIRQVYEFSKNSSGKVMKISENPVLETVPNSISQPNDQNNEIAVNK